MVETKLEEVKHQADDLEAYEQSMELLSCVGYTRAKSKTVQPFDKVAGGMVWCIERCSFDIDVDLYFKDNLNIGQKIALTEALVQAFRLMKCPHSLEPHQIQGLDYLSIYPVVKWLVEMTLSISKDGRLEGQRPKITMKMLFPEFIQSDDEDAESQTSENMDEQIGQLEDLLSVLMEEKKNLEDKQNLMAEEYSEIRSRRKKIAEEEETPDFQSQEEEMKFLDLVNLVSEVGKAKENEKSFKEKCRKEKEEIEESIRSLLEMDGNQLKQEEDQAKVVELQAEKERLQEEFGILAAKLAETNLRCSQIQRRLADIPSRSELSLYQKTFLQMNDQADSLHVEDLTQVTWAHGVNSVYSMTIALESNIDFLEADISLGQLNGTDPEIPIMAHPPVTDSDLSLAGFLDMYFEANSSKGMKLDFKDISVLEDSLMEIKSRDWINDVELWLNADILPGPNNNHSDPVSAEEFLSRTSFYFPEATLSVGWKTDYGFGVFQDIRDGDYSIENVEEMINMLRYCNITQPVTFPVRAGIAASPISQKTLPYLLSQISGSTLTFWSASHDCVDYYGVASLINSIGRSKSYIDVPANQRDKILRYLS